MSPFPLLSEVTMNILSMFREMWHYEPVAFPAFDGERIMMMPVKLGSLDGVPIQYRHLVSILYGMTEARHIGQIGYLTIDEKELKSGQTMRRAGPHVDGWYHGGCGAWGSGPDKPGGSWGSAGNGMLVLSNTTHCRFYPGLVVTELDDEGGVSPYDLEKNYTVDSEAGTVYWVDGLCVHESMPVEHDVNRQFIRLSMPSSGPWFKNYTPNPTGIKPSNEILERRTV